MSAMNSKRLWAAFALGALILSGCPTPTIKKDGGTGGGAGGDCILDSDCPDPQYFWCDTATSTCKPNCRTKSDCNQRPAAYALPFSCGSLGCECDQGNCVVLLCSADSECGGQVCRNGTCVAAPSTSAVAKCQVSPDYAVLRPAAKARFWVSAWDAQNNPIIIKDGITWSAVGSAVTGSGSGVSADFTAGSAAVTSPTPSVRATLGSVNCEAKVVVLASPSANQLAVSVVDELSGRPVPGAKVLLSQPNGTVIRQGNEDTVTTDSLGYAVAMPGGASSYSVSVFHSDFTYLTVANYAGTSRFLSFALRRNPLDKYGGYKGGVTNVPQSKNVHAAIAGMSMAGSITDLNFTALLGPSVYTDIMIGSAINRKDVPIPAGAFLGFGDQKIKNDIAGLGLNGTCLDASGNPDEPKIASGGCGTRTAWAMAGDVPLGDLPIDLFSGDSKDINIGTLLAKVAPIFEKFNSSVVRDVSFTLRDTPLADGGKPNYEDQSQFTTANHDFTQSPLSFNFVVKMPQLPRYKDTFADAVAIIGGAGVVGRGVVPLGIGVGVNTKPLDGQIDALDQPPPRVSIKAGHIGVRMSPTHHGLEGSTYGLLIAAVSAKGVTDASAGIGASALFPRLPANKLVFDPLGTNPVDISGQSFPAFPEGAKFNFGPTADGAVPPRSFRMPSISGVNAVRVSFSDSKETKWEVLVDPASPGFTLPAVPGALRDRLYANGNSATGNRSTLAVQAFRMTREPADTTSASISFNDYVEFNDTNANRTTDFLTAFSFLSYGRPNVSFKTPKENPATLARGDKLVIEVDDFSLVTDGVVKLSFTGGMGCSEVVLSNEVPMAGSGEVEHVLPTTCTGTAIKIQAELLKSDRVTPLAPPVATSITATIQ